MAKILLDATDDNFIIANNNTEIVAASGVADQTVVLNAGVTGVTLDSNIDDVDFSGNVADYTFQETGAGDLNVCDADGTLLSTIKGASGKSISFADGTVAVDKTAFDAAMTIGETAITTTAAAVVPADIDIDDASSNAGGSTAVSAQTFTLTTTADTFIDQNSDDNDTLNMTLTAINAQLKVSGIENVNADWDAYSAISVDSTNIDGATITISSEKSALGNATVTAAGDNTIVAGSGVVGILTANGVTDATVTGANATKIIVDGATAATDSVTVTAGDNTTTTTVGGTTKLLNATVTDGAASTTVTVNADNVTLNASTATTVAIAATAASTTAGAMTVDAAKASTITIDGTAAATDTLALTTGVSTNLDLGNTTTIETVTLAAADATTVTLVAGSTFTTLDSTSADTTTISAADIDDLDALDVTNSGAGTLKVSFDASTQAAAAVDLSDIAATQFDTTGTFVGQDLTFASGATVNLDKDADLNASTVFLATGTATNDTLNMSVASDIAADIDVLDGTNDIETLNQQLEL